MTAGRDPGDDLVKATLVLADGSRFPAYSFGARAPISGELVFSTGMVGYAESLTDPSYRGQVPTQHAATCPCPPASSRRALD